MADEMKKDTSSSALVTVDTANLSAESLTILNQLITEQDAEKQKDLTYLFNQNQKKKTMVRVNKLSDLADLLVDKIYERATTRPDEMTTKELIDAMKTASDLIEHGQKTVNEEPEKPLIQINQQDNSVNVGDEKALNGYSKESRDKVKNVVLSVLSGLMTPKASEEVVEATVEDKTNDN